MLPQGGCDTVSQFAEVSFHKEVPEMVRTWISVIALVLIVVSSGVQALEVPFFQRPDGTFGYVVQESDDLGQWQIALGYAPVWLELVGSNPQLWNPDLIQPGDTLNIPASLARTFQLLAASDAAKGLPPVAIVNTVPMAPLAEKSQSLPKSLIFGIAGLITAVFILIIVLIMVSRGRKRVENDLERERLRRENEREVHRAAEQRRQLENPYSGPPVVKGGLPTIESAIQYFTEQYRTERRSMTVAESEKLPSVTIERIIPVDVRGQMRITFNDEPALKDIPEWIPAWQCFLSDGSFRLSLMFCGNDVRRGEGMEPLPETQIRPRQDSTPSFTPETPVQVWPVAVPEVTPAAAPELPTFVSAKADGPRRYVLHAANGKETIIDLGILPDITLGIEGDEIFARIADQQRVIGRIVAKESGKKEEAPGAY